MTVLSEYLDRKTPHHVNVEGPIINFLKKVIAHKLTIGNS
jgi:hypothetical protein